MDILNISKGIGVSDYLAAERTYLAWIRTCLALVGFGVAFERIDRGSCVGLVTIMIGAVFLITSTWRYFELVRLFDQSQFVVDTYGVIISSGATTVLILCSFGIIMNNWWKNRKRRRQQQENSLNLSTVGSGGISLHEGASQAQSLLESNFNHIEEEGSATNVSPTDAGCADVDHR